jgi:hypothetical protein
MQIRCYHCHKPFAMGKEAIQTALQVIHTENLSHYNANCPHCRRVNRVSRQELLRAAPDWTPEAVEQAGEPEQEKE